MFKKRRKAFKSIFWWIDQEFKTCFETCKTCDKSGNKTYHNCITCEPGYQLKPEGYPQNNCVPKCPYYAINAYDQYNAEEKCDIIESGNLEKHCIDMMYSQEHVRAFIDSLIGYDESNSIED